MLVTWVVSESSVWEATFDFILKAFFVTGPWHCCPTSARRYLVFVFDIDWSSFHKSVLPNNKFVVTLIRAFTSPSVFFRAVLFGVVLLKALLATRFATKVTARQQLDILVLASVLQGMICHLHIQKLGLEILLLTSKLPFLFLELISLLDQMLDLVLETSATVVVVD